jgi:hypothetical protein
MTEPLTPFQALAAAMGADEEITSATIAALSDMGFQVIANEAVVQLCESYQRMLHKYYKADDDLTQMRLNLQWVLSGKKLGEEVASGDTEG